jgi:hypothetical protein
MNLEISIAQLKAALDPLLPVFLLIDPMVGEPITMQGDAPPIDMAGVMAARHATWQRDIVKVQLPSTIDLAEHLHPYLVMLQSMDDIWLQASLEIALGETGASQANGLSGAGIALHRMGGWLQTSESIDVLSEQISVLAKLNSRTPTNERYLRVADRRTLDLLRWAVGDSQLCNCLTQLNRWVYVDALANISVLKKEINQELIANKLQIKFDVQQWGIFTQASALHTTMARWFGQLKIENKALPQTQLSEIYQRVVKALKYAKTTSLQWPHYFKNEVDQYAWAVIALLSPELAQHQRTQDWLKNQSTIKTDDEASKDTMNIICHRLLADYRKQIL